MSHEEVRPVEVTVPDFPRLHARTQGFSLGVPRSLTVASERTLFLRGDGDRPEQALWCLDDDGERLLADAASLMPADLPDDIPAEERARRERARERGSGIVAYATDTDADIAVFALSGKLMTCDVATGLTEQLAVDGPVVDPRPSPDGGMIAYVEDEALWVVRADGTNAPRMLARDSSPDVSWGLAEFVAGEEMGRTRGYWWAPDGRSLVAARVDTAAVHRWWIAGPVDPDARPTQIRYPAAGTPNAEVTLAIVDLGGNRTDIEWDREALPYVADVVWTSAGPPLLVVQSRDQRRVVVLAVDPGSGTTEVLADDIADPWIELVPGSPTRTPDGRLVRVVQADDTRRIALGTGADQRLLGDPDLMVASIVGTSDDAVTVTAHVRATPWCTVVATLGTDGTTTVLSDPDGVAGATGRPGRLAIVQRRLSDTTTTVTVDGVSLASNAQVAPELPVTVLGPVGGGDTPASLLLHPSGWTPEDGPLPVLVDSYGGPHARRVLAAGAAHLTPAWFAANGFAVLVTDGPGAPGQSLAWEAAIHHDLAGPPLQGQVDALHRASQDHPGLLDLDRVGIRGWSFGGYLAALAVLRRPDVFHTAVSGAPVTDWTLYDTHYTERYLGVDAAAAPYTSSSIIDDAPALTRPLLLIHGLADDNVVAAHTLRLSRALLEAGRPHEVLPLSGVTHFTPNEAVNANLTALQLTFLQRTLGLDAPS